jgi:homoserine kinase
MSRAVRVTVPASAANLGPGFDTLALAVSLRNEVIIHPAGGLREGGEPIICVDIEGCGQETLPRDRSNMVVAAALRVLRKAVRVPERLRFRLINRVPLSSGLGSSAAATVGGLIAANEVCGKPLTQEEVLALAVEIEGHPDNVSAALLGGLTVSVIDSEGRVLVTQPRVRNDLLFVFCVPKIEVRTPQARKALPARYSREDAVFSLSRVALLTALLQGGEKPMLRVAMEDRIHQPYRSKLAAGIDRAMAAALKEGALGACLSGSGPTVLALADRAANPDAIGRAMSRAFAAARVESESLILDVSRQGARVGLG